MQKLWLMIQQGFLKDRELVVVYQEVDCSFTVPEFYIVVEE